MGERVASREQNQGLTKDQPSAQGRSLRTPACQNYGTARHGILRCSHIPPPSVWEYLLLLSSSYPTTEWTCWNEMQEKIICLFNSKAAGPQGAMSGGPWRGPCIFWRYMAFRWVQCLVGAFELSLNVVSEEGQVCFVWGNESKWHLVIRRIHVVKTLMCFPLGTQLHYISQLLLQLNVAK